MERLLHLARRIRSTVGGDSFWGVVRPAYWATIGRLSGDAGVRMSLSDGCAYRLDPELYAWQPHRYEPDVVAAILAVIRPQSVVYDIGAHVGLMTLMSARRVTPGVGRIYAFEPSPDNFALLERHIRVNGYSDRVSALHTLVGERSAAAVSFSCRPGQFTANSLAYNVAGGYTLNAPMASIDDMVRGGSLPPADVMKIDVEGYEHSVLRGARILLRDHAPYVICAMHPEPLAQLGTSADAIIAQMASWGYQASDLHHRAIATAGFEEVVFRKGA
jgi:FkbM family methyltransferase